MNSKYEITFINNKGPRAQALCYIKNSKKKLKKIIKIFKMGSWVGFGPIWTADSNSTRKTSDDGFRSVFLSIFENLVIRHLSPFGYPAFFKQFT